VLVALGCGQQNAPPSPHAPVSQEPGEIELSDPQVTLLEPTIIQFEVKYRFTKGRPDKYYSCEISFPDTPENHRVKFMENWELKDEGTIRDRLQLSKPGVKSFEIHMSESLSPRTTYKKISNTVSGPVQ
jgi:hypothetical protein